MKRIYKDKNGRIIEEGMTIKHDNGNVEKVYGGDKELGINAVNMAYAKLHPELEISEGDQIYPLYQFDLREWEIVD